MTEGFRLVPLRSQSDPGWRPPTPPHTTDNARPRTGALCAAHPTVVDAQRLPNAPLPLPLAQLLADTYEQLPSRARYVLTVRLGLGGATTRTLRKTGEPLVISLARVQQIQVEAMDQLVRAMIVKAAASGVSRGQTREKIVDTLRVITVLDNAVACRTSMVAADDHDRLVEQNPAAEPSA